jgi:hypothetical protein
MKTKVLISVLAATLMMSSSVVAGPKNKNGDPGNIWDVLPDELRGDHYTLNIHGKKTDFNKQDCIVEPDPYTGEYSNNIFIPSEKTEAAIQILMESGNAKGKWASENNVYGVRDSCTAEFDGNEARLVLPANQDGYFVTARVLAKPTDDPSLTINNGQLKWVQDEAGNDLLVLGLVTETGFETPEVTMTRTSGKVKAVDISGVFRWSGDVCYFDTTNYCYNDLDEYVCANETLCCIDNEPDGIYDDCVDASTDDGGITYYCGVGFEAYSLVNVGCYSHEQEWVFNIADYVGAMWDAYPEGGFKLANIRFYPIK